MCMLCVSSYCAVTHRKASLAERKQIDDQTKGGIPPKLTLHQIHNTHKDSLLTATYIYNIRYRLRAQKLQGVTPIQALFTRLKQKPSGGGITDTKKTLMATSLVSSSYTILRSSLHGSVPKSSSSMLHTRLISSTCHLSTS
jgi:hypothetical protein